MTTKREAIRALYATLDVPADAAPNLDALADVLRDLSWRPVGPVVVRWTVPDGLPATDRAAITGVLRRAVAETHDGLRPIRLVID